MNDDINVLALIKGKERYIFLYDDSQRAEALRMLGRHASNPELSFSWYDAAVLSQKIRQEERQQRSRLSMPQVTDSEELFQVVDGGWSSVERQKFESLLAAALALDARP